MKCVVHGDDFTVLGAESDLKWFAREFAKHFEIKIRDILGPDTGDAREMRILNRIVRWTADGLEYEADQRHAEIIVKEMVLETAAKVNTPGTRSSAEVRVRSNPDQQPESRQLSAEMSTQYRQLGARANYLATDRGDITFASKEICRDMSAPTEASWAKLKRLARYLMGSPRLIEKFYEQETNHMRVYADSDWAGCIATRKSTSRLG